MNCQGIARVLDDGRVEALTAAELEEIEAHLATCTECAGDWEIDARIRTTEIPPVTERLLRWHPGRSSDRSLPASASRRRGRLVVIPLLLAGAAAAALMLGSMLDAPLRTDPVSAVVDRPAGFGSDVSTGNGAEPAAPAAVQDAVAGGEQRHRLVVLGPVHVVQTAEGMQTADAVHRGVVQFFRARPDIEVIEIAASELAAIEADLGVGNEADSGSRDRAIARRFNSSFIVRVKSRYLREPDLWAIDVLSEYETSDSSGGRNSAYMPWGSYRPDRTAEEAGAEIAQGMYGDFLPDSGFEQFLSVVKDAGRSALDRLGALEGALGVRQRDGTRGQITPDAIEAAIELARTAADASGRRATWEQLAQSRHPSVAQPMADALLYDADAEVRGAVAEGLADYVTEPVVRAALETASLTDRSSDVRLRARWSMSTVEDRLRLVEIALLDSSLAPEERIAPLIYARAYRSRVLYSPEWRSGQIPAVEGEALDVLAEIAATSTDSVVRRTALTELGLGRHRDFVALFEAERDEKVRDDAVRELVQRRQLGGAEALERLRSDDDARRTVEPLLPPPSR